MSRMILAALPMLAALPAAAQQFSVSGGLAVTSNYLSYGYTQTLDEPALQGYLEAAFGGLFFGAWASNVDFGTPDTVELDLYVGYRGQTQGNLAYAFTYFAYYYDDSGYCCGKIEADFAVPITERLGLGAQINYNLRPNGLGGEVGLDYSFNDSWNVAAVGGYSRSYDDYFGELALNFYPAESVTLQLMATKPSHDDAKLALTMFFDATLFER